MADEKIPKKKKTIKKAVKPKKKKVYKTDDPDKPLTAKEKTFVMRYIANFGNGSEAAQYVGISKESSRQMSSEYLTKPNIQRFYNEEFNKAFEETGFMVKQSIQNIARMANSNILDFFDIKAGEIDPLIKDKTRQETSVIESIKTDTKFYDREGTETGESTKDIIHKKNSIKLYDSLKANEIILKMAGKFADKEGNRKTENIEDKMSDFINTLEKKELE